MARILFNIALMALVPMLHGCANNPSTGSPSVVMSSQGGEVRISEEMHNEMEAQGSIYRDAELQEYVNRIGQRLVDQSDMPDKPFRFYVIDSPDINAFATPGGYIYINRGLLAYLDNEAELAGVLGHEIAHVTARHAGRQRSASITNSVLAVTVLILTGSGDLADASTIYGAELISGYGREMELEADGLGAQYMFKAGYDPESLLEVIGVLKNHEQYQRLKARGSGNAVATYHGLFSTHPKNDKRLKQVINTSAQLDLDTYIDDPSVPGEFKERTDKMVWGASIQGERSDARYYHNKLDFTFEIPKGWAVTAGKNDITVSSANHDSKVVLSVGNRDSTMSPRATLEGNAKGELAQGRALDIDPLDGYTAVATAGGTSKRLAVINYGSISYFLEGSAQDFALSDPDLLTVMESFRAILPIEKKIGEGHYIRYIQVPRGETMATLAAESPVDDAENVLRLINGFYPTGEPRTGDWIRIIQ